MKKIILIITCSIFTLNSHAQQKSDSILAIVIESLKKDVNEMKTQVTSFNKFYQFQENKQIDSLTTIINSLTKENKKLNEKNDTKETELQKLKDKVDSSYKLTKTIEAIMSSVSQEHNYFSPQILNILMDVKYSSTFKNKKILDTLEKFNEYADIINKVKNYILNEDYNKQSNQDLKLKIDKLMPSLDKYNFVQLTYDAENYKNLLINYNSVGCVIVNGINSLANKSAIKLDKRVEFLDDYAKKCTRYPFLTKEIEQAKKDPSYTYKNLNDFVCPN